MKHPVLVALVVCLASTPIGQRVVAGEQEDCVTVTNIDPAGGVSFDVICTAVTTTVEPGDPGDEAGDTLVTTDYSVNLGLPTGTGHDLPAAFCAVPGDWYIPEVTEHARNRLSGLNTLIDYGLNPTGTYDAVTYGCVSGSTNTVTIIDTIIGPTDPNTWVEARIAEASAELPAPTITLSPPGSGVVNIQTWYADTSDRTPQTRTDHLGALTLTITANPLHTTWTSDDTNDPYNNTDTRPVTCSGTGDLYQPGDDPDQTRDCGHTFTYPSHWDNPNGFTITAQTSWQLDWTLTGTALTDSLTITTTNHTLYPVIEITTTGAP